MYICAGASLAARVKFTEADAVARDPAAIEMAGEVGPVVSRTNVRFADPVFPAVSVCETTIFLAPSPEVNVIVALKTPEVQVVVEGELRSPERLMVNPSSQVPAIPRVELLAVLMAGEVNVSAGGVVSST